MARLAPPTETKVSEIASGPVGLTTSLVGATVIRAGAMLSPCKDQMSEEWLTRYTRFGKHTFHGERCGMQCGECIVEYSMLICGGRHGLPCVMQWLLTCPATVVSYGPMTIREGPMLAPWG